MLLPDVWPLLAPGVDWILTGKATRAEAAESPTPAEPRGSSLVRLERRGERLLKRFGVLRETTGVVRDSIDVLTGLSEATVFVVAPVTEGIAVELLAATVLSIPTIGGGELGAWRRSRHVSNEVNINSRSDKRSLFDQVEQPAAEDVKMKLVLLLRHWNYLQSFHRDHQELETSSLIHHPHQEKCSVVHFLQNEQKLHFNVSTLHHSDQGGGA